MQKGLFKLSTIAAAMSLVTVVHADVSTPNLKGGFNVAVEANYLKPYGLDKVFGSRPTSDGGTEYFTNDPQYKFGYGISLGYTLPNTANDIKINYQRYRGTTDTNYVVTDTPSIKLDMLLATEVKSDRLDLLLGQYIKIGSNMQLHLQGGLSYASIYANPSVAFNGLNKALKQTGYGRTDSESRFRGVGPSLAIDAGYNLGNSGLGLIAGLQTSLLVGKQDASTSRWAGRTEDTAKRTGYESLPAKSTVVPAIDAKLGLTYQRSINDNYRLDVEGGYKVNSYINALNIGNDAGVVQYTTTSLSFAGPYLKLKLAAN